MAKAKKLAELSDADLLTRLEETSEELFNLRFQNATGQLTNVRRIRVVRRDKARVLTELRAREIAAAEALEAEEVAS
jgi:large subunit ribosomal protein L29